MMFALTKPKHRLDANKAARAHQTVRTRSRLLSAHPQYKRAMAGEALTRDEWSEVAIAIAEMLTAAGCPLPNVPSYLRHLCSSGPQTMVEAYTACALAIADGRLSVG